MKNIQLLLKSLMLCLALICISNTVSLAQDDPDGWNDPPPNDVPVDGGLSLFIAAGVGYGIKKANDLKKRKQETNSETDK